MSHKFNTKGYQKPGGGAPFGFGIFIPGSSDTDPQLNYITLLFIKDIFGAVSSLYITLYGGPRAGGTGRST